MKRCVLLLLSLFTMTYAWNHALARVWCAADSIDMGPMEMAGLAYDSDHLWATHYPTSGDVVVIYKIDATTHQIVAESGEMPWNGRGICFGNGSLWVTDALHDVIREIDPTTFEETSVFSTPGTEPNGITFDGTHLWLTDPWQEMVYQLDIYGNVLDSFSIPNEYRWGLEWEAPGMWMPCGPTTLAFYTADGQIEGYDELQCLPDGTMVWDLALGLGKLYASAGQKIYIMEEQSTPAVITVLPDGTGDVPTIQEAINIANEGDIIILGCGTFMGDGNRDLDLLSKNLVISSASGNPESCIIDCQGSPETWHTGISITSGQSADTRIEGITITGAYGDQYGAAWVCFDSSPIFVNCRFVNNGANLHGGAVFCCMNSNPEFQQCLFESNYVEANHPLSNGGAVRASSAAAPIFRDCVFRLNRCDGGGGAASLLSSEVHSHPELHDCLFEENWAPEGGAIMALEKVNVLVSGCTFVGNESSDEGSAVYCRSGDSATFTAERSIFYGGVGQPAFTCESGWTVALTCCNVYDNEGGDWVGCLAGQDGTNGNFSADPLFCMNWHPDAPYTLMADSPCAPENSGGCGLIGAYPVGCYGWKPEPRILTILDFPNDQGGAVRISWLRSEYDSPEGPVIQGYDVLRREWPGLHRGAETGVSLSSDEWTYTLKEAGWDYVRTVPARGDSVYQAVFPTLCDSTETGICWSMFKISARTDDPLAYFVSEPDSGYSIDNRAPMQPRNLHWENNYALNWDESEDEDFHHFAVYGSDAPSWEPGQGTLIWQTGFPGFNCEPYHDQWLYFHVAAADFSGNRSEAASIQNKYHPDSSVPPENQSASALMLYQNRPNPARGHTEIRFELPHASEASLAVFDVTGRRVATLVQGTQKAGEHSIIWNGQRDDGTVVRSGIYFCRLSAQGETRSMPIQMIR